MDGKKKKSSNTYIILIIGSAVLGMLFSILYLGFQIFIPAGSALCLGFMFLLILMAFKKYPDYLSKKQMIILKVTAWIGLIAGLLAALIQLILFFKF